MHVVCSSPEQCVVFTSVTDSRAFTHPANDGLPLLSVLLCSLLRHPRMTSVVFQLCPAHHVMNESHNAFIKLTSWTNAVLINIRHVAWSTPRRYMCNFLKSIQRDGWAKKNWFNELRAVTKAAWLSFYPLCGFTWSLFCCWRAAQSEMFGRKLIYNFRKICPPLCRCVWSSSALNGPGNDAYYIFTMKRPVEWAEWDYLLIFYKEIWMRWLVSHRKAFGCG